MQQRTRACELSWWKEEKGLGGYRLSIIQTVLAKQAAGRVGSRGPNVPGVCRPRQEERGEGRRDEICRERPAASFPALSLLAGRLT